MRLSSDFKTIHTTAKCLSLMNHLHEQNLRFMVVKIEMVIFWVLTQCSLVGASGKRILGQRIASVFRI